MDETIKFLLNGEVTVYTGSADNCLLDVLRDQYKLTGVKCGCNEGECGACSVLMDGNLVNSCMIAMGRVNGTSIMTIEGYSKTDRFSVLEKAFSSVSAVQCGFCIPGMVLAAEALLSKNSTPSDWEIRTGISGNLCRCTGYNAIVKAIHIASEEGEGLW
jgi:carbon-monoxide dehydrogenase small subunit